jgi:Pentapeptide repeats (8 copies)
MRRPTPRFSRPWILLFDGRTTTVHEIEEHCRASGLGALLGVFQEGAKAGVTRLLAAFFFRQYGQRPSGDPTFVFTHKSFGEYLTARRIVRAIERANRELGRRYQNPDEGWDERDALKHWAQICGPSAISQYLHPFLLNEMKLQSVEQISRWQSHLSKLFNYMLRHGMPMEQLQIGPFKEASFQSRNAEESLLVALNACSRITKQISTIDQSETTAFGAWFRRIQGQRTGPEPILAALCMSFLGLNGAALHISDFYEANFAGANLQRIAANYTCFIHANFSNANLLICP